MATILEMKTPDFQRIPLETFPWSLSTELFYTYIFGEEAKQLHEKKLSWDPEKERQEMAEESGVPVDEIKIHIETCEERIKRLRLMSRKHGYKAALAITQIVQEMAHTKNIDRVEAEKTVEAYIERIKKDNLDAKEILGWIEDAAQLL